MSDLRDLLVPIEHWPWRAPDEPAIPKPVTLRASDIAVTLEAPPRRTTKKAFLDHVAAVTPGLWGYIEAEIAAGWEPPGGFADPDDGGGR